MDERHEDHGFAIDLDHLCDFRGPLVPSVLPLLPRRANLRATVVDPALGRNGSGPVHHAFGIDELQRIVEVPADEGAGKDLSRDVHVLLRQRLLRKSHGFEGLRWISKRFEMKDLSISERPGISDRHLELDAGVPRLR